MNRFSISGWVAVLLAMTAGGCSEAAKKARTLERADTYFAAGDYEKAKGEYINVLRFAFKDGKAIARLADIWLAEGCPLRAYPYLVESRETTPTDLHLRTSLAALLSSLGDATAAREEALAVVDEAPANQEALLVLADSVRGDEEVTETQERLRRVPEGEELTYHLAWATLANRTGDLLYAERELRDALAVDPRCVRAHLMIAELLASQHQDEEAEREFRSAVGLSSPGSEASLQYAEFKQDRGARDEARAILQQTLHFAPHYEAARTLLAHVEFGSGNMDSALTLLERVLEVDFANLDALMLQAQVRLAKGDTTRAAEGLERLDVAYPNVPLIKYHLARAYINDNRLGPAAIALDAAIAGRADFTEAILLRAQIQLRNGSTSLVVAEMLSLLGKHPNLRPAQSLLAAAYRAWGRREDAVAVLREEIKNSPDSSDAYLQLGVILAEAGRNDEARQAFRQAMCLSPDDLTAFDHLVNLDISTDDFAGALQVVREQLTRMPGSARVCLAMGKVYAAKDNWPEAEPWLLKATQLEVALYPAYELLVFGYIARGHTVRAIAQLEEILARNPNDERSLMTLGLIYERQGDPKKALAAYDRAIAIDPKFTAALVNLAGLEAGEFNDLNRAYELARRARILDPGSAGAADALGWTLYRQGHYEDAMVMIEEAATASPEDPKVQFHLGMAAYMMALPEQARAAFKKAASSFLDTAGKTEAARWLAYLDDDAAARQLSSAELEQLLRDRPNDVLARLRFGSLKEREGHWVDAAAQYQAALETNPRLSEALLRLARLYTGPLRDPARALETAKAAREIDNGDPRIAAVLGKAALQNANCRWAADLLGEALRQLPQDRRIMLDLGWADYSLGKISPARELFRSALATPGSSEIAEEAKTFLRVSDLDAAPPESGAGAAWELLLQHDPGYVPALFVRGRAQGRAGKVGDAVETYLKILRQFPEFAPAQKELARIYLDDPSMISEAYDLALKAHNSFPDDGEIAALLGEISYRRNQFDYAIQLLEKTARQASPDPLALYYLGMSYLRRQRNREGETILQRSLNTGLAEPHASEAKRLVAAAMEHSG